MFAGIRVRIGVGGLEGQLRGADFHSFELSLLKHLGDFSTASFVLITQLSNFATWLFRCDSLNFFSNLEYPVFSWSASPAPCFTELEERAKHSC